MTIFILVLNLVTLVENWFITRKLGDWKTQLYVLIYILFCSHWNNTSEPHVPCEATPSLYQNIYKLCFCLLDNGSQRADYYFWPTRIVSVEPLFVPSDPYPLTHIQSTFSYCHKFTWYSFLTLLFPSYFRMNLNGMQYSCSAVHCLDKLSNDLEKNI